MKKLEQKLVRVRGSVQQAEHHCSCLPLPRKGDRELPYEFILCTTQSVETNATNSIYIWTEHFDEISTAVKQRIKGILCIIKTDIIRVIQQSIYMFRDQRN